MAASTRVRFSPTAVEESADYLHKVFGAMDRPVAYVMNRRVSQSGMTRRMSIFVVIDGDVCDITHYAGAVIGWPVSDVDGYRTIRVDGCGMDMGFHLVYVLSATLYAGRDRAGYVISHRWL